MNTFWDVRYSSEDYAYGTEPNEFLKTHLSNLPPGKILFPGEGEGRNAVYAAGLGWNVHAFDSSSVAAKKAAKLSASKNVKVHYQIADMSEIKYREHEFDCIALLFFHLFPGERTSFHKKMLALLKPGGILLLEAFSKKQIENNSGGPKNINMLYAKEELNADFPSASEINIMETEVHLNEGRYHQGNASLIRVTAKK